jgi:hypothetical protein
VRSTFAPFHGASKVPQPATYLGQSLTDPAVRRQRAQDAAKARTTIEAHVKAIVDRAPELTPEQRDKLALLLRAPSTVDEQTPATPPTRAPNEIHPCPGCGYSTRAVDLCQNCRAGAA